MSEKILLLNKYTLRERFKQLFTGERRMETIVQNGGDSIGYIGLTQSTGRIIVIDQASRFRAMKRHFDKLKAEREAMIAESTLPKDEVEEEEKEGFSMDDYLAIGEDVEPLEERLEKARMKAADWNLDQAKTKQNTDSESFETNFYVREQYVLVHSNNVDIVFNNNFEG